MHEWLDDHDTLMYSTHKQSKSVVAERFIRALKAIKKSPRKWQLMVVSLICVIWID